MAFNPMGAGKAGGVGVGSSRTRGSTGLNARQGMMAENVG